MNNWQKKRFVDRIVRELFNSIADKKIAVFGFAFKKDTVDTRESAAIGLCRELLEEKANVCVYDPRVTEDGIISAVLDANLGDSRLSVAGNAYEASSGAHAIAIMTDWDEFRILDYTKIFRTMSKPAYVFDGRNILDLPSLRKIGFRASGIGKPE